LIADFRLIIDKEIPMELFDSLWKLLLDFAVLAAIVWLTRRFAISASRRAQTLASNWPIAQGTVEHASPKMVGEGRAGYWVGELSYSYSVDGDYHAGVAQLPASSEDNAYEAVRGWKDRKVQIRYEPGKPTRSILVLEEQEVPTLVPNPEPR
jgi:hypothetical protein